jgi:MFS family permease
VCFYKFGAFVAGAVFLRFSGEGQSDLSLLYGVAGLLYAVGFMVALFCLQTGGQINQNDVNHEEEKGKPVKISKHAKICGFLLTQKLFGTAFRTLLPLYILDNGILRKEHIAAYTGTLPLIAGTFGSAFGGMIPTLFQRKSEVSVQSLLYGQTTIFTIASIPSYFVFSGHVTNDSFMLFTSVLITVLSFLGGAQTTLVFVRMAEIVKENEFKENRNQLYCWLCSVEIIGKLLCGIIIGSVAEVLGYSSSILLCLGFQFLTLFLV